MKWYRRIYRLALAALLFAGWMTGVRGWFLALFAGVGLLLVGVGLNVWTAVSFSFSQTASAQTVTRGETLGLTLSVHNDKPFPFTMLGLTVHPVDPEGEPEKLVVHLPPQERAEVERQLLCPYRGEWTFGLSELEVTDLFALAPMRFPMSRMKWYHPLKVMVYPRLYDLPLLRARLEDEKQWALRQTRMADAGDSFAGPRQYREGDRAARIHWKATAKERELYTRQYELPRQGETVVLLDNRQLAAGGLQLRYESLACECAAALCREHLRQLQETRLRFCGDLAPLAGRSPGDFDAMYQTLARVPFHGELPPEAAAENLLLTGELPTAVYLVTGAVTEALAASLEGLRSRGIRTVCLLAAPEEPGQAVPPGVTVIRRGEDLETLGGDAL